MQFKRKTISLLRLISIIEDDSSPDCQLLRNHFYLFFFSDIRENQVIAMNYAPKLVPISKILIKFTAKFLTKN